MNIDLLLTREGHAGLIFSENLVKKLAGVVMDLQTGIMTLEYADMDHLDLNIPISEEFFEILDLCKQIQIGAIKNGHIAQAYQIPLMFQDDPYRAEALGNMTESSNPLREFEYFIKACVSGQPVHRTDLSNEDSIGCVLGDSVPSSLEFAPHLARRHQLEAKPVLAPNVPGLGLGTSGGSTVKTGGQQGKNTGGNNNSET